jgi:hypothetical protein
VGHANVFGTGIKKFNKTLNGHGLYAAINRKLEGNQQKVKFLPKAKSTKILQSDKMVKNGRRMCDVYWLKSGMTIICKH